MIFNQKYMKKDFVKLGKSFVLFAWLVGSVGGFFALMYHDEQPLGIAMLATIVLSFPTVKSWIKELL